MLLKHCFLFLVGLGISGAAQAVEIARPAEEFNLSSVREILSKRQVTSVKKFITELPDFMKEQPSVAIGYATHGLLPSSFEHPNFFLFGDTRSKVVVVFRGEPNPREHEEFVELLSFDSVKKKHSLHEIRFKRNERPYLESRPSVMAKKCGNCHGTEATPLWRAGYGWPGFFGAEIDVISPSEEPFYKRLTERKNERSRLINFKKEDLGLRGPNIKLTARLSAEHASSIAERLLKHPNYLSLRSEIVSRLALCEEGPELLDLFARFGIQKQDWFMNLDLEKDSGSHYPQYFSKRSAFEGGIGPIEFQILSHLLARDAALRSFESFFVPFPNASYVRLSLEKISSEFPARYFIAKAARPEKPARIRDMAPDSQWCKTLTSKLSE